MDSLVNAADRWEHWQQQFEAAHKDLQLLALNQLIWLNVVKMLKENTEVEQSSLIQWWLVCSHVSSSAMGARRHVEVDKRSDGIASLLHAMCFNPRFLAWEIVSHRLEEGPNRENTARVFYEGDPPEFKIYELAADLESLKISADRVRRFATKRIAHSDSAQVSKALSISVEQVHELLNELYDLVLKYSPLFCKGATIAWMAPELLISWTDMFARGWKPENFLPIEAYELGTHPDVTVTRPVKQNQIDG